MSNRNYEKTYVIANGSSYTLRQPGEYVMLRSISTAGSYITVKTSEGDEFRLYLNNLVRFLKNNVRHRPESVTFENTSGSSLTIGVMFGDGEFESRDVSISGTVAVEQETFDLATAASVVCGAAATSQLFVADTNRRKVEIHNPVGSGRWITIGDSAAAATRGIAIGPGETYRIETYSALYAYNPGPGSVTVQLTRQNT